MRLKNAVAAILIIVCLHSVGLKKAIAACSLPYTFANGQTADATLLMANLNALLSCVNTASSLHLSGSGGGVVTLQNPSATTNYNFNLPASAGTAGQVLTSSGGGASPETWTSVGTSGHVLPFLDGGNTWSGTQTFGPVVGAVTSQSGTTYTLAATDCGTTILFTSASAITLTTLNSLPPGCAVAIEQAGTGQVTVADGSGATHHSSHGFSKTYGQYAILGLFVDVNSGGSAADFIITGDGA